jgi:cytoskeletal protein CcmA (bactofilin family)
MVIARDEPTSLRSPLMLVNSWKHQSLLSGLRFGLAALRDRAGWLVLRIITRGKSKMAEQTNDLDLPTKPARPAPTALPQAADPPRSSAEPAPATASPPMPLLVRPSASATPTPASPRPRTDQSVHLADNTVEPKKLIVGPGISLSGEINACERLVVEGSIQANLQDCRHMTITETGLFDGNAAIDEAEVYGRFEGDLVVRNRLLIRATGQVSGTIRYGQVEIEAGGRISGSIQAAR